MWISITFWIKCEIHAKVVKQCTVVFDGHELNIKDHERLRRCLVPVVVDFHLCPDTVIKLDHAKFLANEKNNFQLVNLLLCRLEEDGHTVILCRGDADITIVKEALVISSDVRNLGLICSCDTDILCMLI